MKKLLTSVVIAAASLIPADAITIIWDYSYDTDGWFTSEKRDVLAKVAQAFDGLAIDSPDIAQPPGEGAYWDWVFDNPQTGASAEVPGFVAAGSLTIFLGAQNLGGAALGYGGPVSYNAFAFPDYLDLLGSLNTEEAFKPFAGSITISSTHLWYTGLGDEVTAGQFDLYSVVLHELGHILGIGTSLAWSAQIEDGLYYGGANVQALLNGAGIPVLSDESHPDDDLLLMAPFIGPGVRKYWTDLEYAMLLDMGYAPIPEPTTWAFAGIGLGVALLSRRRIASGRAA